jgi:hypothetical protein
MGNYGSWILFSGVMQKVQNGLELGSSLTLEVVCGNLVG